MTFPFPSCPVNRECHVKENQDKKSQWTGFYKIGTPVMKD